MKNIKQDNREIKINMNQEVFNDKWKKAKILWKVEEGLIKKVLNDHYRETYEDMYYRGLYYFSLTEAKHWIKKCNNTRTPDGHSNSSTLLKDYKIIKSL
jgi:hypothetical protein